MKTMEFEGQDLDAAIGAAVSQVGVSLSDLRYRVVSETRGMLGAVSKGVVISVDVPDQLPVRRTGMRARPLASSAQRPAPSPSAPRRDAVEAAADAEGLDSADDDSAEDLGPDPSAPAVATLLGDLIAKLGLELSATMTEGPNRIVMELRGEDRDRLLERGGETLDALQYLLNRMARRTLETKKRVQLESEGFRIDRDAEIRTMALEGAERVRRSGQVVRLPPLNSYERRIVHVTLAEDKDVRTQSEGEGFVKRIAIRPTGGRQGREGARRAGGRGGGRRSS